MKKSKIDRLLRNTAFGIFIGIQLTLVLAAILDSGLLDEAKKFYTFVISATISIIAATLTLIGVFANIENQQGVERRARERKLAAARAFLPSSLSRMCDVCVHGMQNSHCFSDRESDLGIDEFEDMSIRQLLLSDEIISVFRDIIELSADETVTNRLSGLVREHQILLARWKSEFSPDRSTMIRIDSDFRQRTVSWAYLYAITASIFEYARGESDQIEGVVGEAEIRSAMNTSGLPNFHPEDFQEEIGLYARTFIRRF